MNVSSALKSLATAGISKRDLAHDLKVHLSTVYRWAKGSNPSSRNHTALRDLVHSLIAEATAKPNTVLADWRQVQALQDAADALLTDTERAADDDLAGRINAHLADVHGTPEPAQPVFAADDDVFPVIEALATQHPGAAEPVSITAQVDPFAVFNTKANRRDDAIDSAFAA